MRGGFRHRITADGERYKLSRLDRKILGLAWEYTRPHLGRLVLAFGAMLLVTGTTLAVPYLTKIAVDDYITAGDPGVAGLNRIFLALLGTQGLFGWPPTGRPSSPNGSARGLSTHCAGISSGNYSVWT